MAVNLSKSGSSSNPILLLDLDTENSFESSSSSSSMLFSNDSSGTNASQEYPPSAGHRVSSETSCEIEEICKLESDHDETDVSSEPPLKKLRQEETFSVEKENKISAALNEAQRNFSSELNSSISDHEVEKSKELRKPIPETRDSPLSSSLSPIEYDSNYAKYINLYPIPDDVIHLPLLTSRELAELELALQLEKDYPKLEKDAWKNDWSGNLAFMKKEILLDKDRISENPHAKRKTMTFCDWVTDDSKSADDFRGIRLLFSLVYHTLGTPLTVKRILAHSLSRPAASIDERRKFIDEAVKRTSNDPYVLTEDGWTTKKADKPDDGGAYVIGQMIYWKNYIAIVIAFVKDDMLGDLWKALWTDDGETFDLEPDELQEALKNYEQRSLKIKKVKEATMQFSNTGNQKAVKSLRYEANRNFKVEGAEHGIVLAMPPSDTTSKPGVLWPARILHVKECKNSTTQGSTRRNSSRSMIEIVFLAPYWNGSLGALRGKETLNGLEPEVVRNDLFSSGAPFEYAAVEASEDMISKYPYSCYDVISIDKLRAEFSLTGLPPSAFSRFLDSHRLAMALRFYARLYLSNAMKLSDDSAALTESHPLSVRAPEFPSVVLNLPYDYILSKLPHPSNLLLRKEDGDDFTEDVFDIRYILESMSPPNCWKRDGNNPVQEYYNHILINPLQSPQSVPLLKSSEHGDLDLSLFTCDSFFLRLVGEECCETSEVKLLGEYLKYLLSQLNAIRKITSDLEQKDAHEKVDSFLFQCLSAKAFGDEYLSGLIQCNDHIIRGNILKEWKKICEKLYRTAKISSLIGRANMTTVITDSRCNQHITANGSIERAVRLPVAIAGAKRAGAGSANSGITLITKVEDEYLDLAEMKIIPMAHKSNYIKRLKEKICSLNDDAKGVPLTEDSDGDGGEDTVGSRGSYSAAVTGVAAALKGVDMVVRAATANAFCAVRPPGHHAGRDLRPMKAVSNGFCLLNAVACAALYAVTPRTDGGLGLKRVCVIDFDVHHGNGTQDILCSTYDPRFLYVSTHAGGASVNGLDEDDSQNEYLVSRSRKKSDAAIFPGRCGDFSPHEGVLNIPLGKQVTTHAIGLALSSKISQAVEIFSPDLILLSAGFDAHKNDPLGMGGLSATDFGIVTKLFCEMAQKVCSGRLLSILEGGYGVPCCRPLQRSLFLPNGTEVANPKVMNLGEELPETMEENIDAELIKKTENCHQEGFLDCVKEHVESLYKSTSIS